MQHTLHSVAGSCWRTVVFVVSLQHHCEAARLRLLSPPYFFHIMSWTCLHTVRCQVSQTACCQRSASVLFAFIFIVETVSGFAAGGVTAVRIKCTTFTSPSSVRSKGHCNSDPHCDDNGRGWQRVHHVGSRTDHHGIIDDATGHNGNDGSRTNRQVTKCCQGGRTVSVLEVHSHVCESMKAREAGWLCFCGHRAECC